MSATLTSASRVSSSQRKYFSREYPSNLSHIDAFCSDMRVFLHEIAMDSWAFEIELLCREGLTNAIEHGNKGAHEKRVLVEVLCNTRWLLIRIRDEGPGFDYQRVLEGGLPGGESERGRGLQILRLYAQRVSYNKAGNQVSIWKKIQKKEETMSTYDIESSSGKALICLGEELTASIVRNLKEDLATVVSNQAAEVVFDFEKTVTLDSSGIGLLVATHNSLQKTGGTMKIVGVSPDIMRLMQSMRLDRRLNVTAK